jgi:hypothetical protein
MIHGFSPEIQIAETKLKHLPFAAKAIDKMLRKSLEKAGVEK